VAPAVQFAPKSAKEGPDALTKMEVAVLSGASDVEAMRKLAVPPPVPKDAQPTPAQHVKAKASCKSSSDFEELSARIAKFEKYKIDHSYDADLVQGHQKTIDEAQVLLDGLKEKGVGGLAHIERLRSQKQADQTTKAKQIEDRVKSIAARVAKAANHMEFLEQRLARATSNIQAFKEASLDAESKWKQHYADQERRQTEIGIAWAEEIASAELSAGCPSAAPVSPILAAPPPVTATVAAQASATPVAPPVPVELWQTDFDMDVPYRPADFPAVLVESETACAFLTRVWAICNQWSQAGGKHRVLYKDLLGVEHANPAGLMALTDLMGKDLWVAFYPKSRVVSLEDTVPNQFKNLLKEILLTVQEKIEANKAVLKASQKAALQSFEKLAKRRLA